MLSFTEEINIIIRNYKMILKRHLDSASKRHKIKELGIDRMAMRQNTDTQLHEKAEKIYTELKSYIRQNEHQSAVWYSGIDRFYQHLQEVLNNYHIQNGKAVHSRQAVSHAFLRIIQTTFEVQPTTEVAALEEAIAIIESYGTKQEKEKLQKLLNDEKVI